VTFTFVKNIAFL